MKTKNLIIGDGWAALGAAGFLAQSGQETIWLAGTGARLIPPLPSLEVGKGVAVWKALADRIGVETGEARRGSFIREFRNKSFREASWVKAPTPDTRIEVRDEALWAPEARFAGAFEARFEMSLADLEERIRLLVLAHPNLKRMEDSEIQEIKAFDAVSSQSSEKSSASSRVAVLLGSGDTIEAERVIFADRWSSLLTIQGLPKGLPFLRSRQPVGALQAMFTHEAPIGEALQEGFYGASHKDAGDEMTRNVWGHFFSEGRKSVWTLFLEAEEGEDNHEIMKKLRRLKQALDRMFVGTAWLPEGKADFMATVQAEQYRFEDAIVYCSGTSPAEPVTLSKLPGMFFLTDAYGPSRSMEQVGQLLGEELQIPRVIPVSGENAAFDEVSAPI